MQTTSLHPRLTIVMLAAMMFLQFFIKGAWYIPVTGWLNQSGYGGLTAWV